ncbi:hypothetical protein [Adhaeribacter aquaticus]|uniref:hypothetical protein n=1 Tax=Adhaeribacter aquaticus TaxID=299567 RepID=UPI0004203B97|nr:hypothetical protein [Adhaeribacter aquaticus]
MYKIDETSGAQRATREAAEMLFGEENLENYNTFQGRLDEIEQRHADFFKNRKSSTGHDEYDRLHNHYQLHNNGGKPTFSFREDSDLPPHIKEECHQSFYEVWGT